ncbi:uncharacterized protein MICPUCDRAFT_52811 [Micromonas pusilla CCMP1545]|uniref:Predicted protein n=1 Tax=Micromonas pusilla (strain CCMP1545) TaxID=564608 RepID=C1N561_MICPC|nr:uncharacterized protein MICPUCDRAFT_52811 [Micromonas pusilla CCMP1545]EEH53050.1 predicted protein [Micromonas pusilla CCMP1545]|eukprot:XP_003063111.1 predicted protein [Micromonas pusilla CCMP1545]
MSTAFQRKIGAAHARFGNPRKQPARHPTRTEEEERKTRACVEPDGASRSSVLTRQDEKKILHHRDRKKYSYKRPRVPQIMHESVSSSTGVWNHRDCQSSAGATLSIDS